MHLNLQYPVESIKEMDPFELPEFAVLIGRNGIGKTRLLSAISNGAVTVDGISPSDIEHYDTLSFQPVDSGPGGWGDSAFFHHTVDRFLHSHLGRPLVEVARETFLRTLDTWGLAVDQQGYRQFDDAVRSHFSQIPAFGTLPRRNGEVPQKTTWMRYARKP